MVYAYNYAWGLEKMKTEKNYILKGKQLAKSEKDEQWCDEHFF